MRSFRSQRRSYTSRNLIGYLLLRCTANGGGVLADLKTNKIREPITLTIPTPSRMIRLLIVSKPFKNSAKSFSKSPRLSSQTSLTSLVCRYPSILLNASSVTGHSYIADRYSLFFSGPSFENSRNLHNRLQKGRFLLLLQSLIDQIRHSLIF